MYTFKKNAKFLSIPLIITIILSSFLTNCKGGPSQAEREKEIQDSISALEKADTLDRLPDLTKNKPVIKVKIDPNFEKNKVKIEKRFGAQWDFCRCVLVNDSLDRLIKSGGDLNDNFMKKFDEVEQKCKAFLVMSPNQSPEERALHEKKIKACLKK